jgi:uncharacterized protein
MMQDAVVTQMSRERLRAAIVLPPGDPLIELPESTLLAASLAHVRRCGMDPWGLHGLAHWWRVRHNAQLLALATGASLRVVRLFAIFHDSHRHDDGHDPEHGARAATWLAAVRSRTHSSSRHDNGSALTHRDAAASACPVTTAVIGGLSDAEFEGLHQACLLHTGTRYHSDPTVATCFAADRLDLSRVEITPDPEWMPVPEHILTPKVIAAAIARERGGLSWQGGGEELERVWGVRRV